MLDFVMVYLGEVFLDTVIDKSQSIQITKKKRIICNLILMLLTLFYIVLFLIISYISISSWKLDRSLAIKMFIVSSVLIIAFIVYGNEVITKRKERIKYESKNI